MELELFTFPETSDRTEKFPWNESSKTTSSAVVLTRGGTLMRLSTPHVKVCSNTSPCARVYIQHIALH